MATVSAMPSGLQLWRRCAQALGWLSLFATLALLSPGVVATADAHEWTGRTAGSIDSGR